MGRLVNKINRTATRTINVADKCFAHVPIEKPCCGYGDTGYTPYPVKWERDLTKPVDLVTDHYIDSGYVSSMWAWLIEPVKTIHIRKQSLELLKKYGKVFTYDEELLLKLPNTHFVPAGGTWIPKRLNQIHVKSKLCSFITSGKRDAPGHYIRHEVYNSNMTHNSLDTAGTITGKLSACKSEFLVPYMFSVVIESHKFNYYFTEKIIDCFLTGTIPIYWGCDDIGKYFNLDGIIFAKDAMEITHNINRLTPDMYHAMLPAVMDNYKRAQEFTTVEKFIHRAI